MPDTSGAEILVVEDSPTQAEELQYTLERHGFGVITARNGAEALTAIGRRRPALVVSDIIMPEMDGFALCAKIKQAAPDVPVILLTALSDPQDVLKGLECGADNFITKPYGIDHLLTRIRRVLDANKARPEPRAREGVELPFKDQTFVITSDRRQILDILLSTYEAAVMNNRELKEARSKLEELNEGLEKTVEERTAALVAEIAERKKAEDEVRRLNVELEQRVAERTAELEATNKELESFAYSVSHDLRAPLRHIEGFADILRENYAARLDEKGRDYLQRVISGAGRMKNLIDAIIKLSRHTRAPLNRVNVRLSDMAKAAAAERAEASPERTVDVVISDSAAAEGDPMMLQVVINNLIENSWKFTRNRRDARIEFGVTELDGKTVYYVRDNGAGFDESYSDRLFTPFQRLHSDVEFPGLGVGLATVQRIIRLHGGRIWAEGAVGKGATFYFTLS
jgi:signal transduction histidine kinase